MQSMYLESIALTRTLPCLAEPGKIIVVGKPESSLAEVIPYLATLPGIIAYNPETCTLTFRRSPGFLTLSPEKVYITQVQDTEEGLELLAALKDAVNATWEHRQNLKPATESKRAPRHLDIYELLPQTNCKRCGEASCLAFAVNLILHKRILEECTPLQKDVAFTDRRATLEAMLYS
jgi:ArsR family metal-binding transcriptional regulator